MREPVDIIVDDAKTILSNMGIEPKCPKCGSITVVVSYSKKFIVKLDKGYLYETTNSGIYPNCLTCSDCGEIIWVG